MGTADWRVALVDEMNRRGWRLTLVSTVAAGVLVAGCSNDDVIPEVSAPDGASVRSGSAGGGPVTGAIVPVAETDPVRNGDDAADDPAIWVNPADPSASTIIGTDKDGGLGVYDLEGNELQYLPDGELNNVDLRDGFPLAGEAVTLVTAGDRGDNTIAVYKVDPATRRLQDVAARELKPSIQIYGSCMYKSPKTGAVHFIATSEAGDVEQWELFEAGGRVDGRSVRTMRPDSDKSEGCVADDDTARLYVGEEEAGIWRYGAEPGDGEDRVKVDATGSGRLVADVEGLAIAKGADGGGYLVASSQGDSTFVLYERSGSNAFVRRFRIGPGAGVDGVEETDGIEVTTADLGGAFGGGVFVVQDGTNPGQNQNFKLIPWASIVSPN